MAYIVQAHGASGGTVYASRDNRKEALAVAIGWAIRGRTEIKIVGDGRIYTAQELGLVTQRSDDS